MNLRYNTLTLFTLALLMAFTSISIAAPNADITVKHAELTTTSNQTSLLQASIDYTLNDSIIDALNNGITLTFDVTLIISQPRSWLWKKRLATLVFPYRLKYHTLSQTYQVTDVVNNRKHVFSGLTPALNALGTLTDIPLHNIDSLDLTQIATLKVALNIEALPLPMRPLAYVTSSWYVSSDSYQWSLSR